MAKAGFPLSDVLPGPPPRIKVVDVGALPLEGVREPYAPLLDLGLCDVVGFEPDAAACEKLLAIHGVTHSFLPYVVGDGSSAVFRQCNHQMTSSIFEPNSPLLDRFQNLGELTQVVAREEVVTRRLDDLPEVAGADFLKLDVQGAEAAVIAGAQELLESVLLVQTEVEFVPLYRDQPLFAEVDQALRARGFLFHRLLSVFGRTFKPLIAQNNINAAMSQMLWGEAVYAKDFMALERLEPVQLVKLALILHELYDAYDFAHACLAEHDRRGGARTAEDYMQRLAQARFAPG